MSKQPAPVAAVANVYRTGDLLIDTRTRKVYRDGGDLPITGLSFDLVLALARAAPNLLSFETLMEQVWPGAVVSPETLTQRVKLLRQALGDSAESPRYVLAVRGHGYRMPTAGVPLEALPVPLSEVAPDTIPSEADARSHESPLDPPTAGRRRARLPIALTLCAAAAVLITFGTRWAVEHAREIRATTVTHATERPGASIAVMPFGNHTGDTAKDYFGDGMAEALIDTLGRVPGLKVPDRAASFSYRGRNATVRRIARDLGVATVLEGDVQSAGERIRVSTRLLDARSGAPVWQETYERPFSELFKLQDDMAAEIVRALHVHLGTALPTPAERSPPTHDLEAYRLYLQARAVSRGTPDTETQAQALVNQALERDPNFAQALAYRGFLPGVMAALGADVPRGALAAAERDVTRALALSPGLPDALANLASIHAARAEWVEAERSYRAALMAEPGNIQVQNLHTLVILRPAGRLLQAYSSLNDSYRLAPAEGFTIHELALVDSLLGHDADALHFMRLHDELGGGGQPVTNAQVYLRAAVRTQSPRLAMDHLSDALPVSVRTVDGVPLLEILYSALADPKQNARARRAFAGLLPRLEDPGMDGQTRGLFVLALTMLGDLDTAYDIASRAVDEGTRVGMPASRIYLPDFWSREMRPFRRDPRFSALMERLRLFDYWRQYGPPDDCALESAKLICH